MCPARIHQEHGNDTLDGAGPLTVLLNDHQIIFSSLFSKKKELTCKFWMQIPFYVSTKMVGFKTQSFFTPSPEAYSQAAVRWIGYEHFCIPFWTHRIQWYLISLLPDTPSFAWRLHSSFGNRRGFKGSEKNKWIIRKSRLQCDHYHESVGSSHAINKNRE